MSIASNMLHIPIIAILMWLAWRRRAGASGVSLPAPFRLFKWLALIALFGLAGCAHHEKLAVASGPVFALNPGHWQAAPADLAAPDEGK